MSDEFLNNSFETPSRSLLKASSLAFSKLSSLPVNNSASNSSEIDDSKFVNDPAMLSTSFSDSPSLWAADAALANACGLFPSESFIDSEVFATSLNTAPWLTAALFAPLNADVVATTLFTIPSTLLPEVCDMTASPPASSAVSPIVFFNAAACPTTFSEKIFWAFIPVCLVSSPIVSR